MSEQWTGDLRVVGRSGRHFLPRPVGFAEAKFVTIVLFKTTSHPPPTLVFFASPVVSMGADLLASRKAKGFASHLQGGIQDWRRESRPLWAAKSSPLPNFETRSRFFLQNAILGADYILSLRKRNNSWLSFWVFLLLLLHRENLLGVFSVLFPSRLSALLSCPLVTLTTQWRTFFFLKGIKFQHL